MVLQYEYWHAIFPLINYTLCFVFKEYKVELILKESWRDPRLAYGNDTWFVKLKHDMLKKLWYPDTLIENSRKHDADDKTRTAYLFGDGTIFFSEWFVRVISQSTRSINQSVSQSLSPSLSVHQSVSKSISQ